MNLKITDQKSKVLNYGYLDYSTVFWDQNNVVITIIHENDGEYRDEYMKPLFIHFGITVKFNKRIPLYVKQQIEG